MKATNHEHWYCCPKCGFEYDLKLESGICPVCGEKYKNKKA